METELRPSNVVPWAKSVPPRLKASEISISKIHPEGRRPILRRGAIVEIVRRSIVGQSFVILRLTRSPLPRPGPDVVNSHIPPVVPGPPIVPDVSNSPNAPV